MKLMVISAAQLFSWIRLYCKFPKYSDTQNICCNHCNIWTMWLYHRVMSPKDADGMANSVDPDQTAPLGAVWSRSVLFAQAYLSENLGSLWYVTYMYMYLSVTLSTVFGQTGPGKPCRPRSDCCWRSRRIRVYTVCRSVCIFWTHDSKVKPYCSNFRIRSHFRCQNIYSFYSTYKYWFPD